MSRMNISSGAKWESIIGYSRAVRVGTHIYVSGTISLGDNGRIVGSGNPYQQTIQIFKNIEKAIQKAGGSIRDVVRTRMYVTNIEHWEEVGRAHSEYFLAIKPATTMVEVSKLIEPEILVEIEALAIVNSA